MGINKEVWSTMAEENLFAKTPLVTVCDTKYEGEIQSGNKVHVYTYSPDGIALVDYDGDTPLNFGRVKPGSLELLIDQAKAFGFRVDKIDLIQNSSDTLMKFLDNKLQTFREEIDLFLLTKAKASITTNIVDNSTIKLDKDNIIAIFESINVKLDDNDVSDDRFAYVDSNTLSILKQANLVDILKTSNDGTVGPKTVYRFGDRVELITSSKIKGNGTTLEIIFGSKNFINFAGQITELEELKLEGFFGDAVKGLFTYGAAIFNEKKGAKLIVKDYSAA